ncbi:hypothetical protein KCM76_16820 [Zooshikella marina]|uniref:hypothetical protein n=1 Tax=Zooshikella ganghwensis TaxID=202772 RepID=UPI000488651E|nr:hypothetical protein [Zooshikella ganghwensis]MBU2707660.1 hypothetical protein [Zooshikella ganghwensis]
MPLKTCLLAVFTSFILLGCSGLHKKGSSSAPDQVTLLLNQRLLLQQGLADYSQTFPILSSISTCTLQDKSRPFCGFAYSDYQQQYIMIEICSTRKGTADRPGEGLYFITPNKGISYYPWYSPQFNKSACQTKKGTSTEEAKYILKFAGSNVDRLIYLFRTSNKEAFIQLRVGEQKLNIVQ